MKRFFSVRKGRVTGIFTDYNRVQDSVKNFSGAEYKGFATRKEAEEYLGINTIDTVDVIEYLPEELSFSNNIDTLVAYVDGSYCKQITTEYYGAGVVLIHPNRQETISLKGTVGIELNNVAGELAASMHAMKVAKDKGYKKIQLHHDYTGICNWITGEWTPKNKYTKQYKEFYELNIKPYIEVEFIKVKSHSKDHFNDLADYCAKRALTI
jgi:ribonuclease HI